MTFSWLLSFGSLIQSVLNGKLWGSLVLSLCLILSGLTWVYATPAIAGLTDDRYDGDIFALYASNGSLVPPRYTLKQAFERQRPILLVFYVDDSSDCKQYSSVVSRLQEFYGRAADFLAVRVDSLDAIAQLTPIDEEFYYKGVVPQTVLFDAKGKPVLNEAGTLAFERVDDELREVFDLLPRSQSVELKRRPLNEINTELVQ